MLLELGNEQVTGVLHTTQPLRHDQARVAVELGILFVSSA